MRREIAFRSAGLVLVAVLGVARVASAAYRAHFAEELSDVREVEVASRRVEAEAMRQFEESLQRAADAGDD